MLLDTSSSSKPARSTVTLPTTTATTTTTTGNGLLTRDIVSIKYHSTKDGGHVTSDLFKTSNARSVLIFYYWVRLYLFVCLFVIVFGYLGPSRRLSQEARQNVDKIQVWHRRIKRIFKELSLFVYEEKNVFPYSV